MSNLLRRLRVPDNYTQGRCRGIVFYQREEKHADVVVGKMRTRTTTSFVGSRRHNG